MTPRVAWGFGLRSALAVAGAVWTAPAAAQSLTSEIGAVPDGVVAFSVRIKEDVQVCANGVHVGRGWRIVSGRERAEACTFDEAEVRLQVRDGEVVDLEVGPPSDRSDRHLGLRDGQEAADYLLGLAASSQRENVARDAVAPAALIEDAVVWPGLLTLARDRSVFEDAREQSVFWISRQAAESVSADLASLAEDDEADGVRDAAVFALSQRSDEEGVPLLMTLAVASRHRKVRESAMFWLAQSKDSRVLPFFEAILNGAAPVR